MYPGYWEDNEFLQKYTTEVNGTTIYLEDEAIKEYVLVHPMVPSVLIGLYLLFVFKLGPDYMAKKKAMKIKKIMNIYNVVQAVLNLWLLLTGMMWNNALVYFIHNWCTPMGIGRNPYRIHFMAPMVWYVGLKYLDLLDTVFMVLRKKTSHISILHVYHHTAMALTSSYLTRYHRDEPSFYLAGLNLFIHVIMYSYYMLSNFGPKVRQAIAPYKIIITKMQIGQFVIFLSILLNLHYQGCGIRTGYILIMGTNVFIFLVLFLNFYWKSYVVNKDKAEKTIRTKEKSKESKSS